MAKKCDNTSAGVLIWKDDKLLLIERKKFNPGFAIPAGHCDGDTPEEAAVREISEEVGLDIETLDKKLELQLENPCKRDGGTHHNWTIFEASEWNGEISPSRSEVKSFMWADRACLRNLAEKLEGFMEVNGLSIEQLEGVVSATNGSEEWTRHPGLEPPMYILLRRLEVI